MTALWIFKTSSTFSCDIARPVSPDGGEGANAEPPAPRTAGWVAIENSKERTTQKTPDSGNGDGDLGRGAAAAGAFSARVGA